MSNNSKSKSVLRARILRRNTTAAENRLWSRLRSHRLMGVGFRRQHPLGPYIVDFCAPRKKIIVELDGEAHRFQKEYDAARTMFFRAKGYTVLRFWNDELVKNIKGVMKSIQEIIEHVADK